MEQDRTNDDDRRLATSPSTPAATSASVELPAAPSPPGERSPLPAASNPDACFDPARPMETEVEVVILTDTDTDIPERPSAAETHRPPPAAAASTAKPTADDVNDDLDFVEESDVGEGSEGSDPGGGAGDWRRYDCVVEEEDEVDDAPVHRARDALVDHSAASALPRPRTHSERAAAGRAALRRRRQQGGGQGKVRRRSDQPGMPARSTHAEGSWTHERAEGARAAHAASRDTPPPTAVASHPDVHRNAETPPHLQQPRPVTTTAPVHMPAEAPGAAGRTAAPVLAAAAAADRSGPFGALLAVRVDPDVSVVCGSQTPSRRH